MKSLFYLVLNRFVFKPETLNVQQKNKLWQKHWNVKCRVFTQTHSGAHNVFHRKKSLFCCCCFLLRFASVPVLLHRFSAISNSQFGKKTTTQNKSSMGKKWYNNWKEIIYKAISFNKKAKTFQGRKLFRNFNKRQKWKKKEFEKHIYLSIF